MTAGIDAAVVRFFGEPLMQRVQHRIMDEFFGEQPVGTAFVLSTGHPAVPFLAHAPTMRVPGSIEGTDKVYSATWAALLAIHAHNRASEHKIEVAVFPAMGTGFGGVPYGEAARQMAVAYRHYLEPPHKLDWDFVAERQRAIHYDGRKQVRYPIAKARGFPALTFPRGEDSESRASYEAALHAALAWPLLTKLCFGAPHGVS